MKYDWEGFRTRPRCCESASTTEGTTPSSGPVTLAADASPEDVRQAILAALENIGPVRVEATVSADMGELTSERHAEQLLDPVRHLARETISSPRGWAQQASVIGNETVRVMGEGVDAQIIRSVQLRPPTQLWMEKRLRPMARASGSGR